MPKFNVRVRIIDPYHRAHYEDQEYEADTGLEAMQKAQADEKNTSRGLVQCNGCDSLPAEPIIETIGEKFLGGVGEGPIPQGALVATEPMAPPAPKKRGRPKAAA